MTTKPQQNVEIVHDRQAKVSGPQETGVVVDVVDNPYGPGKISVTQSTRDDPLAGLHARRFIDAAQYAAGRHWQQCWEDSEIGAIRAIDTTKEPPRVLDLDYKDDNKIPSSKKKLKDVEKSLEKKLPTKL